MTVRDFALVAVSVILAVVVTMIVVGVAQAVGLDEAPGFDLVMILMLCGGPLGFYFGVKAAKARKRSKAAQTKGFELSTDSDEDLRRRLTVFPAFSRPSGKVVGDRFRIAKDGVDVTVFDYSYMSVPNMSGLFLLLAWLRGGMPARPRCETAVLCQCQSVILPQFFLHSRKIVRQEERAFEQSLGEEVLMPPEFFKKYSLRGFSTDRIRPLFTLEVVSYYLKQKGFHTEGMGDMLIVYRPYRRVDAEDLMPAVDEAIMLLNHFRTATSQS